MKDILIIEDEEIFAESLQEMIFEIAPDFNLLGICKSVSEAKKSIIKYKPKLIFLDIILDDGTAFDLLNSFENIDFDIIFVTSHPKYAVQAFDFAALHYLLKPVEYDDLKKSVDRFLSTQQKPPSKKQIAMVEKSIDNKPEQILLREKDLDKLVQINDIARFESSGNYAIAHLSDKTQMLVSKSIKYYETLLKDYGFLRVHNQHLINSSKIKRFHPGRNLYVILEGEIEIQISKNKRIEFLTLMQKKALK